MRAQSLKHSVNNIHISIILKLCSLKSYKNTIGTIQNIATKCPISLSHTKKRLQIYICETVFPYSAYAYAIKFTKFI